MQKIKILVIEDNENNMYLTRFLLEMHGYEVLEARDGQEGLKIANEHYPNLILLDIQLPGMDGFTVLDEIRQKRQLDDISVIAVTSFAMKGDRDRILSAGCNGYIEKPINPDTFVKEIEQHLPMTDQL